MVEEEVYTTPSLVKRSREDDSVIPISLNYSDNGPMSYVFQQPFLWNRVRRPRRAVRGIRRRVYKRTYVPKRRYYRRAPIKYKFRRFKRRNYRRRSY